MTEWQSHRVTESQTLKGTQYTGGWNFFVPDFNKLPYSLRSQGENVPFKEIVSMFFITKHISQGWYDFLFCFYYRLQETLNINLDQVVSIGFFWFVLVSFSYNGVSLLWSIFNRMLAQYLSPHYFWATFLNAKRNCLTLTLCFFVFLWL